MAQPLAQALKSFTSPHDEAQLRQLDETVSSLRRENCGPDEFRELLGVFERFPEDDGYGIFWSIVHFLETCSGYEPLLIESVSRVPTEFNVLMVNRLINGNVLEVDGQSLLSVLASLASNPAASSSARRSAQGFLEYQAKHGRTDA